MIDQLFKMTFVQVYLLHCVCEISILIIMMTVVVDYDDDDDDDDDDDYDDDDDGVQTMNESLFVELWSL